MTITLTHHALDRMKARTNFSPTRAREIAEEVYYCGKTIKDFKNDIDKYNPPVKAFEIHKVLSLLKCWELFEI